MTDGLYSLRTVLEFREAPRPVLPPAPPLRQHQRPRLHQMSRPMVPVVRTTVVTPVMALLLATVAVSTGIAAQRRTIVA